MFIFLLLPSQAQTTDAADLVGRLLLLAYPSPEVPVERLSEFQPAGFLFYASNLPSLETARATTQALQAASAYPLLFGIDQEGGPFSSLRGATLFPGQMALAATGDPDLAYQVARATGEELGWAGFNLVFGPVADVNSNPDNPIIGLRSFGSSVEDVAVFTSAYIAGLEAAGIAGAVKHFPGHGDTAQDSHLALPTVKRDRASLAALELPPFRAAIAAAVPAVMTAHVVFGALEPDLPATLSSAALTDLLRGELGFGGLIVTDFMDMNAIAEHWGPGEAAVRSVLAGADVVLLGPDSDKQREVYSALQEAVRNGRLSEARLREAVARSDAVAARYAPQWEKPAPDLSAHAALAEQVATAGATLLWNDGVIPLGNEGTTLVISPRLTSYGPTPTLGEVLAEDKSTVSVLEISNPPSDADLAAALPAAAEADRLVLGSYHWQGAFPESLQRLEASLAATEKPFIVVALGNPDDLRFFSIRPGAYLAVYGFREANLRAARALLWGEAKPHGKLPVPVGDFPSGTGLEGFE